MLKDEPLIAWINVANQLPEADCMVLASHSSRRWVVVADFHDHGDSPFFTLVFHLTDPNDYLLFDDPPIRIAPTHWMPVPEAPR